MATALLMYFDHAFGDPCDGQAVVRCAPLDMGAYCAVEK